MDAAQLVNLIIRKLQGNRVEFTSISYYQGAVIEFRHLGNVYSATCQGKDKRVNVFQVFNDHVERNNYSNWIEGVLNGMVRDEEGVLRPST